MGEIHKLTKDGVTLFPATITDAIAHPELRTSLSNLISVYNVSNLYPDKNITTLSAAINLLNEKLKDGQKIAGIKVQFIGDEGLQEWAYTGNTFTDTNSWSRCDSWYTYTDEDETAEIVDYENLMANALRKTKQDLTEEERQQVKENIGLAESVISTTWADLKERKDAKKLVPGQYYKITDYVTTTKQENTKSVGIPFCLLVEAISIDKLSSEAKATQSDLDLTFNNYPLEKWIIRYDIENDQTKYAWADPVNGKGVIYYMRDEWNNEAWYDFKNIQFKRNCSESKYSWIGLTGDKYFYTFSRIDSSVIVDDSLGTGTQPSSNNHLGRSITKISELNGTIFIGNGTSANFIEDGHKDNTFGEGTKLNKIGHNFIGNTISGIFQENNVGTNFTNNTIYKFTKNTVLGECSENIFPKIFNQNKIGSGFKNNSFKVGNGTTDTVNNNEFGNNISYVKNLPASFEKVNILNNTLDYTENTDANQIILFDNKNLYNLIISLDDKNDTEEECGVEISKYEGKLIYTLKSTACTYNLGEFNTSGDAENEAKNNVKISYNKEINIIKYSVTGSAPGQGLILQQVGNLKTTQYLFWDGNTYKRTIRFTNSGGNITIDSGNTTGWAKVLNITSIEYNNSKIQLKDGSDVVSEVTIPEATDTTPGLMSVNDKTNISELQARNYIKTAEEVSGTNDRDTPTKPSDYHKKFLLNCLKKNSVVGIENDGIFSEIIGTHPWNDFSGISAHELAFTGNGRLLHRTGIGNTSENWGEWRKLIETTDLANVNNSGIVKLDSDYTKTTEGTALSLEGAKNLNEAIDGKIKLLNNKIEQKHDDLKVQTLEEIFYSDLVAKRNNGKLVPGQKYRIIDYTCSANLTGVSSAGHDFDIIVEAISKNELSEDAKACITENKINIFTSSDIGNWEDATETAPNEVKNIAASGSISTQKCTTGLAKSGDIITVEFTGIYKNNELIQGLGVTLSLEGSDEILVSDYGKKEIYNLNIPQDITEGTNIVIKFYIDSNITNAIDGICGVKILKKSTDSYFSSNNLSAWELKYSIDKRDFNWPDTSNFKGVIYYLKDEYDNECSYDFKNILFNGYYTFSYIIDDVIYDGSVKYKHCYGNKIKPSYNYGTYILGKNIFKNTSETAQCVFNELLEGCEDNVFGNNCSSNKLGNYCKNNTFGYDCQYNTFDSFCKNNTFGNKCQSNTFGVQCQNNTFGSYILRVNFGKQCLNNKLTDGNGNNLSACRMITFGDQCNGVNLYTTAGTSFDNGKWLQNIKVNNGLSGDIEIENLNTSYSLLITKDKDGNIVKCIEGSSVAELTKNITYSDLKTLRDNNELIPGQKYRITDYVTTSSQKNTTSAGYQFDIIVEALSENVLNETASACLHEGDTYFEDSTLEAWELKYCLDNDTSRFAWAKDKIITTDSTNVTIQESLVTENIFNTPFLPEYYIYIDATGNKNNEYTNDNFGETREGDYFIEWGRETTPDGLENQLCIYKNDLSSEDYIEGGAEEGTDYGDKFFYWGTEDVDGITYDKWKKYEIDNNSWNIDSGEVVYLLTSRITNGDVIKSSYEGNGVIYYMKDEYNNECPYDFKNIQFYNNTNNTFFYTFSWVNENNEIEDLTLRQDLKSDEETPYGTYSNTIKPYYVGLIQQLNNIIFVSNHSYDGGFFYGCYNNCFGNNCLSNSFGNDCYNNSFGNNCYNNSFGNTCYKNNFGNECNNNSLGDDCTDNSFGSSCCSNSFGNNCYNNSFGSSCCSNSLGEDCNYNNFGNGCCSNSFGNGCYNNSFGNNFDGNSFGGSCHSNSFGNDCKSNSFGNNCLSNSFGNNCYSNSLRSRCSNNSFENDCNYNNFGNDCSNNSFENNCKSNSFENNCSSNSFEINCQSNSFGNNCLSNSFGNNCLSNNFGNGCSSNSFGNGCSSNNFGNVCNSNSFGNDCLSNNFGNYCNYNNLGNDCYNNSLRDSPDYSYDNDSEVCIPEGELLDYFNNNHFSDGCNNIIFWCDPTDGDNKIQNLNISQGLGSIEIDNNGSNIPEVLHLTTFSQDYEIKIARNSKGEVKIYCEADLIQ